MLGLHQTHMSYSPASVAAAAASQSSGARSGAKLLSAESSASYAIGQTGKLSSGGGGSGAHSRRQQLAEGSIQSVRVAAFRDDRQHQLDEDARHRYEVLQVAPQTSMPLVAGAVPKSKQHAPKSKSSRATRQPRLEYELHYQQQEHQRQLHDALGERHFLVRQQQRQLEADNQVLLIMSDTGAHAGPNGIPIIGRRLPSKSFVDVAPQHHEYEQCDQPTVVDAARQARNTRREHQPQPQVLGRRSHRIAKSGASVAPQMTRQPLSIIEGQSVAAPNEHAIRVTRVLEDSQAPMRYPCVLSCADEPTSGHAVAARPKRTGNKSARRASKISSSCLSLSQGEQQRQVCTDLCCQQVTPTLDNPAEYVRHLAGPSLHVVQGQACVLPCCMPQLTGSARRASSASRCASAKRAPRRPRAPLADAARVHSYSPQVPLCRANGDQVLGHELGGEYAPRSLVTSRAHRSSSLSRGDNREATERRSSQLAPAPLLMELSHAHDIHHRHQQQRHSSSHNQMRGCRLSATPPPVPSKPSNLSLASGHHQLLLLQQRQQQQQQQDQESAAVTQMYESLAAELKAKLGNPNRAPILLPPKDYDTLSRQQGKLSGIELRRSTNPALVGPHTATGGAEIVPQQDASCALGRETRRAPHNGHSEAPSSPRKPSVAAADAQLARELVHLAEAEATPKGASSLQRSRSNSSSGLGSISLSASSPDHNTDSRSSPSHSSASLEAEHAPARLCQRQSSRLNDAFGHDAPSRVSSSPSSSASPRSAASCDAVNSPDGPSRHATPSGHYYEQIQQHQARRAAPKSGGEPKTTPASEQSPPQPLDARRGKGIENHNPSKVSDGILWNGRVEIPLKVNSERRNGNTYLATKQIIY